MNIAVLVSGNGSNLQALIDFKLSGHIVGVLSNKHDAYALDRAQKANIKTAVISHKDYPTRELFDEKMHQQLVEWKADLVVLAGFMRILSKEFVQKWQGKIINIHPSLLPAYKGMHTHQRVLETGDTLHGCTVHFVTPELDSGQAIAQGILQVQPHDTISSLTHRVHQLEHFIYPRVVEWLYTNEIRYCANNQHSSCIYYRNQLLDQPISFFENI